MKYEKQYGFHPNKRLFIGVDFDGTLFKWAKFPEIGEPVPGALEGIKQLQAAGHHLVLWTCRDKESLQMAKDKLKEYDITMDWHNFLPAQYHLSSKLDVDIMIDDKSVGCPVIYEFASHKPYVNWEKIMDLISPIRRLTLADIENYEIEVTESNYYDEHSGFISRAWSKDGAELTDDELDWLNDVGDFDNIQSLVAERAMENAIDRAENLMDAERENV